MGVLLEWFLTTRTAAATPRISIFTLSLLKTRAVFKMFPNVCLLISQRWKKISTNDFPHCKPHPKENLSLEYEQNGRNSDIQKLLQTKSALPKLVKWVQLKIYSKRTTHQKRLGIVLNERYFDRLMSLKRWFD